jgi:hypothetical protein
VLESGGGVVVVVVGGIESRDAVEGELYSTLEWLPWIPGVSVCVCLSCDLG